MGPTTSAFHLAGLSKKGVTVEVLERVRQVGPNKQGAKGSYTIYPVASEPGRGLRWTEVVISTVLAPHLAVYGASSTLSKKRM